MIQEVQINSAKKKAQLEVQLALQCAPLLTGIKISNLLIVSKDNWEEIVRLFYKSRISYHVVYRLERKIAFLLYQKNELEAYLNLEKVNEIMQELGYLTIELKQVLVEFSFRYTRYMNEGGKFPHEMGLLLGYPVADVAGFMKHQGRNYIYSGYWKVYDNLTEAIGIFNNYKQAKEFIVRLIKMGVSIQEIIGGNKHILINNLAG